MEYGFPSVIYNYVRSRSDQRVITITRVKKYDIFNGQNFSPAQPVLTIFYSFFNSLFGLFSAIVVNRASNADSLPAAEFLPVRHSCPISRGDLTKTVFSFRPFQIIHVSVMFKFMFSTVISLPSNLVRSVFVEL